MTSLGGRSAGCESLRSPGRCVCAWRSPVRWPSCYPCGPAPSALAPQPSRAHGLLGVQQSRTVATVPRAGMYRRAPSVPGSTIARTPVSNRTSPDPGRRPVPRESPPLHAQHSRRPGGSCGLGSPGTARRGRAGPGGGRQSDVPEGIPAARSHRSTRDATMQIGKVFHHETHTFLTRKASDRTDGCLMLEAVPRGNPMYGISGG